MNKTENYSQTIENFLTKNKELCFIRDTKDGVFKIHQRKDKKSLSFYSKDIENVVDRKDAHQNLFLQVNFNDGKRVLFTEKLVGFAPAACNGLDMSRLPKVVTTPDLLSVIEAVESALYGEDHYEENFEELKLFFESISCGAEAIGFDVAAERLWVEKLISNYSIVATNKLF